MHILALQSTKLKMHTCRGTILFQTRVYMLLTNETAYEAPLHLELHTILFGCEEWCFGSKPKSNGLAKPKVTSQ